MCLPCVHLVSASSPLWLRLQTLSTMCPPNVRVVFAHVSAPCFFFVAQTVYCGFFPKQFTVGFSLRRKGWPRYALAASPELVRLVSATCPPCVVGFGRTSPLVRLVSALCPPCVVGCGRGLSPCPPLVRLVLLALAAPPVLVRFVSAACPPCVVGFGRASSPCPPLVCHLSALCPPCAPPVLVCHLSGRCLPILSTREHSVWMFSVELFCVRHHVRCASLCVCLCPGLFPQTVYSPNNLLYGSLLEERRLAAIHVSAIVRHVCALAAPLNLVCLLCLPHVCPAMCPLFVCHVLAPCQLRSTMCPRLWTLSARGLLWGRAMA